jgi:hypothetical protein
VGHSTPATLRLMERCLSSILLAVPATATATTFGAEVGSDVFKQKWEASGRRAGVAMARSAIALMRAYGRGSTPVVVNEYGWTSVRGTWGSTRPRNVKPYAYAALVGLARLRLAEVLPFEWADASWGLNDGPFAKAVTQITHSRR